MNYSATLQDEIAALLLNQLNVEAPSFHEDLIETGLLDSLKIVELLVELEQHFGMKIPLKDLEIDHFRSIASIANFVASHNGHAGISNEATSASRSSTTGVPIAD